MMSRYLVLLLFVLKVKCFTPNCVPENQFKFYRFPVQGCSEIFQEKCKSHPSGYFKALGEASLVKIGETEVLPTCAFYSAPNLRRIYGVNSKIRVLASGAFTDLNALEGIHLEFNFITDLRKDVFKNVSVEMIDLSWNKIVYIDSNALAEVRNLKNLNLSRNSLVTVSINYLPNTLSRLNLAHNLLSRIALNSNKFVNLTEVDLSNNLIEKVALLFSYPIHQIDLTNNRLKDFDFIEMPTVNKFKLGKNQFEDMPKYLESLNAKEIDLYPNPWKCDQLFLLWETLVSFNIRLSPKEPGKNPPAECFTMGGNLGVTATRSNDCSEDHECSENMVCRTKRCWDPCENSLCHKSSQCETKNHEFKCSCEQNHLSDPLDVHGECQRVDCFTSRNCPQGKRCSNKKCTSKWGGSGFGSHHHGGGHHHGIPTTVRPSATTDLYEISDILPSPSPELPWWFEDIPRIAPNAPTPISEG